MHQPRYSMTGLTYESPMARDVFSQTIHPYTFPAEALKKHEGSKMTLNFTGSLIEQLDELARVGFDQRLDGLWSRYGEVKAMDRVEFTACGHFHPIFPLLPEQDRLRQIEMHLKLYEKTFGGKPEGIWLPEMAFSMTLIPTLVRLGIKWVAVDGPHVVNANKNKDMHQLIYRPHYAEYDGQRVIIIPRDRMISIAQQSGYNPVWLKGEIERTVEPSNDGSFLLTVATDGENGWFRHQGENAGFWGWFYEPLMYLLKHDPEFEYIQLTTITEYLKHYPPQDNVTVEDGSWNVPDAPDDGRFLKWMGGEYRQKVWNQVVDSSKAVSQIADRVRAAGQNCPGEALTVLEQAWQLLLMSEASDNFWWGSQDWLDRSLTCALKSREKLNELSRLCHF